MVRAQCPLSDRQTAGLERECDGVAAQRPFDHGQIG